MNKTVRDILLFAAGFGAGALVMHTVFEKKYETYYGKQYEAERENLRQKEADMDNRPVDDDDIPKIIGNEALDRIGEFAPSAVHVRNHNYHKDYEILRVRENWPGNHDDEEDE